MFVYKWSMCVILCWVAITVFSKALLCVCVCARMRACMRVSESHSNIKSETV